jgi:2-methylcitrate dehydratase PrpD
MNMTGMTRTITRFAADLSYRDLPDNVVHHAKRVILDYLAAAFSGSMTDTARIVQGYLRQTSGPGPAAVLGTDLSLSASNAAFANGTAAHGLEVDDGYTPGSYHPGAPTVSALLAVAQANDSSAEEILLATVVGFELSCRLAGAGHPATWQRGFHNTSLVGVFGAAAAAGKLLGLNAEGISNALGLAGSHAGGLFEFLAQGSEVKRLHPGKAARDGIICAELAARGLTGPGTVLEGTSGYVSAFTGGAFDESHLLDNLGLQWRMLNTYVKPYPCCRHLHGPIDAVLDLTRRHAIEPSAVTSIDVETYEVAARHAGKEIKVELDAQMSIPFAVATTLVHGIPGLDRFADEGRRDPDVLRLLQLVSVRATERCTKAYPASRPARVTLRADGTVYAAQVDQPYGEPSWPVTDADLDAKFLRLSAPVIGAGRAAEIAKAVWSFDKPRRLFESLTCPSA